MVIFSGQNDDGSVGLCHESIITGGAVGKEACAVWDRFGVGPGRIDLMVATGRTGGVYVHWVALLSVAGFPLFWDVVRAGDCEGNEDDGVVRVNEEGLETVGAGELKFGVVGNLRVGAVRVFCEGVEAEWAGAEDVHGVEVLLVY